MGQGSFSQDDGKLTLTLNDAILLPENTSITWGIFYQFQLDENNLPVNSTFTYLFDANPIAVPQNYSPGIVSGKASAEKATGWVLNYNRDVFGNINEAIQSDKTKKGDNVIVCPGEFSEEIIIDKSIHLISYKGKEETSIKTTNPNNNTAAVRIISDDVIIENLTFKESFSGIDIQIGKNISIKDCEFDGNRFHLLGESSVSNVTVKNNLFTNSNVANKQVAVQFDSPNNLRIEKCTFNNNRNGDIKFFGKCINTYLLDNTFNGVVGSVGIELENVENCNIFSNTFNGERENFIEINGGNNNQIISNEMRFDAGFGNGIDFTRSSNMIIKYNKIWGASTGIGGLGAHNIKVEENVISDIRKEGILISGCSGIGIIGNTIKGVKGILPTAGIELKHCSVFNIAHNKITDYYAGASILSFAIYLWNNTRIGTILDNKLFRNCTGVVLYNCPDNKIRILGNRVTKSLCRATGINLTNSSGSIFQNNFTENNGAAIGINGNSVPDEVSYNNFSGNEKGVVNNTTQTLIADNNYWGSETGPAENDISGAVDVTTWLSSPVTLVAFAEADTIFTKSIGETDSVSIYFQNLQVVNDSVNITVEDSYSWLTGDTQFSYGLKDSVGGSVKIKLNIPAAVQPGTFDKVTFNVVSAINNEHSVRDSFYVGVYFESLNAIFLTPDTVTVVFDSTYQFTATGLDQYNNEMAFEPVWSSTGGVVDENGLFTAGQNEGTYSITVQDASGQIRSSSTIIIVNEITGVKEIEKLPTDFTLRQNYPNPFNPATTISFALPSISKVKLKIINILGETVEKLSDNKIYSAGNHSVVWNASSYSSGVYLLVLDARAVSSDKQFHLVKKMMLLK